MTSNLAALGPEAIEALDVFLTALDCLRPLHVAVDMGSADRAVVWIGRQRLDGSSHTLFSGELLRHAVDDERPGVRPSCQQRAENRRKPAV
jgi:hypothetical protein